MNLCRRRSASLLIDRKLLVQRLHGLVEKFASYFELLFQFKESDLNFLRQRQAYYRYTKLELKRGTKNDIVPLVLFYITLLSEKNYIIFQRWITNPLRALS